MKICLKKILFFIFFLCVFWHENYFFEYFVCLMIWKTIFLMHFIDMMFILRWVGLLKIAFCVGWLTFGLVAKEVNESVEFEELLSSQTTFFLSFCDWFCKVKKRRSNPKSKLTTARFQNPLWMIIIRWCQPKPTSLESTNVISQSLSSSKPKPIQLFKSEIPPQNHVSN